MIEFLAGALSASVIAWLRSVWTDRQHRSAIQGIYHGYGAPDENDRSAESLWAE